MTLDDRFPVMGRFLADLPDGVQSYPECRSKASLVRTFLDDAPLGPSDAEALPPVLRSLVERPAPVSSWISEVHSHALMLAAYDRHFGDLEAFAEHAYRQQRSLFAGPLYAIAFKIASPTLLIKTAALRWRMFHRGVSLTPVDAKAGSARARLDYPAGVYEPVIRRALGEALRAAVELSSGSNATMEELEASRTHALFELRWST